MKNTCTFETYGGICKKEGYPFCPEHVKWKCFVCDKQAIRYCFFEGFLVCGMPECADHSHYDRH